jgi:hypothetical protein
MAIVATPQVRDDVDGRCAGNARAIPNLPMCHPDVIIRRVPPGTRVP